MNRSLNLSLNNFATVPHSLRAQPAINVAGGSCRVDLARLFHHYYLDPTVGGHLILTPRTLSTFTFYQTAMISEWQVTGSEHRRQYAVTAPLHLVRRFVGGFSMTT